MGYHAPFHLAIALVGDLESLEDGRFAQKDVGVVIFLNFPKYG
jgi:hypothetical protein